MSPSVIVDERPTTPPTTNGYHHKMSAGDANGLPNNFLANGVHNHSPTPERQSAQSSTVASSSSSPNPRCDKHHDDDSSSSGGRPRPHPSPEPTSQCGSDPFQHNAGLRQRRNGSARLFRSATEPAPHSKEDRSHRIPSFGPHEDESGGPRSRSFAKIRTYADDARTPQFPRISKPLELMRSSYDVVVIGSGYGGGVAASRMARAGQRVCLLERGEEKWPGEYPVTTTEALKEVHTSGQVAPGLFFPSKPIETGKPTGMFHLIFGRGQNAVVCNGLGGTSLINANVFLEADKGTLGLRDWPKEIRDKPEVLEPFYQKAREVLEPQEYPEDWPELPKLKTLEKQAEKLGMHDKFRRVPLTTRFRNGPNSCGVEMAPSALTGQDVTGVNDGSKNTTLVTYLADAWNWGADMFCECEVRYIQKAPAERGGYIVYFAWHGRNRGHFKANLHGDLLWVHAKKAVFLGAGTIGTTEILLRSREMGLEMSDMVGQNMSGNGDILAFGYNTDETVNAIGRPFPSPYRPIGPCITGVIDDREGHENPLDGYVIQEGTCPRAIAPFLQALVDLMPGKVEPANDTLADKAQACLASVGSHIFGPYFRHGAIEKTQIYLVMSHDSNQAVLTLKHDKPVLEFMGVGRSEHVKKLNALLQKATEQIGGTFVQNPWAGFLHKQQVTVHPIGGASMARDGTGETGVTNHVGEVFTGQGSETHKGLIVTDGSIIPCALGINPLATITALAERSVAVYAEREGLHINTTKNKILDLFGEPQYPVGKQPNMPQDPDGPLDGGNHDLDDACDENLSLNKAGDIIRNAAATQAPGFGFAEVMSGFLHKDSAMTHDSQETYELAYRTAKNLCESARFFLSVQAFNTRSIIYDPDHSAMLTGTFVCPTIPGSPFMVQRGDFNLFLMDHKAPGTRNLTYDFHMRGIDGRRLHFHGYKVVDSSVALAPVQFWRSTTTLYVTVSEVPDHDHKPVCAPHDDPEAWRRGRVVAKGMMHVSLADFASQILTMTPTGSNLFRKAWSAVSFLTYFTRKAAGLFLAPLMPLQYPSKSYSGYINDTPPSGSYVLVAADKVRTRMHMWEPTHIPAGQEAKNVLFIPGASVDHQIYATPTIPYNAVNYFCRAGYRVFCVTHRIGQLIVAQNDWTTYDARLDIHAALAYIRAHYGEEPIYTVAHCMGSVAFSCGLLDGTIPASWIRGITASQVFMNPIWNLQNMVKVFVGPIPMDKMYKLVAGNWYSCTTGPDDSLVQRAINELLRLYPNERKELCTSASCHRVSLVYGRCWSHANLNEATHRQIDRFFGGVNMTCLHLLMRMGKYGAVMKNAKDNFEELPTAENVQRLKGIPIFLFVGRENAVLTPASTEKTYEVLTDTFGNNYGECAISPGGSRKNCDGVMYTRRIVPGYGHLDPWIGRNAWRDVYPMVREEMDRIVRGDDYKFVEPNDKFKRMVDEGKLW